MTKSFFFTFMLIVLGFGSFVYAIGYFSSKGITVGNILSVSDVVPSATPTITPTPGTD